MSNNSIRPRHTSDGSANVRSEIDPVLNIWEARNLIAEAEMYPESDEIARIFAEVETALFLLILKIVSKRRSRDQSRLRLVSSSTDVRC